MDSEQNTIYEYSGDYYGITNRYLRNALFPDDIEWTKTPQRVDEATKTATWEIYKFIHVNTVASFGTFRTKLGKWKKLVL